MKSKQDVGDSQRISIPAGQKVQVYIRSNEKGGVRALGTFTGPLTISVVPIK
jgi:hypothetical protein